MSENPIVADVYFALARATPAQLGPLPYWGRRNSHRVISRALDVIAQNGASLDPLPIDDESLMAAIADADIEAIEALPHAGPTTSQKIQAAATELHGELLQARIDAESSASGAVDGPPDSEVGEDAEDAEDGTWDSFGLDFIAGCPLLKESHSDAVWCRLRRVRLTPTQARKLRSLAQHLHDQGAIPEASPSFIVGAILDRVNFGG